MPSYTFECQDKHITEVWCKLSELKEKIECEKCGKEANQCIKFPCIAHTRGCSEGPTKV